MTPDVSIIGLGRVGLPLALSFAERGLRVLGIDKDPERLDAVRAGQMPFKETGTRELLDRVGDSGRLSLSARVTDTADADADADAEHIVITMGTPSFSHIEIDMRDIHSALDDLLPVLEPGHSLILRSTVGPGTTEFVAGYLAKQPGFDVGSEIFVAHAPERIAAASSSRRSRPCRASSAESARSRGNAPRGSLLSSALRSSRRPRSRLSWR